MFVLCLGYQVSYLVLSSTLCSQLAIELLGVTRDSFLGDENSFRYWALLLQFLVVFPISLNKRIKDFLIATIIQLFIIL